MSARATVLVVEDDAAIRRGLVDALRFAGFAVRESADGTSGAQMALADEIELLLLDVMLPGMNGFEVLDVVRRARPTLPVILVTARGAESDRVHGLTDGADDYVVKPFSARELLARVEAVLRRSASRTETPLRLTWPAGEIDLARREVRRADGATRSLSDKEQAILRHLAGCRERVVSREELLERVWGLDPRGLETRTVDMHVARLREKLDADVIATVRGQGYALGAQVRCETA